MAHLQYRAAVASDIAACVALRGMTRENAVSVARLASLGITVESWSKDVESGHLPGHLCVDGDRLAGYCFGDRRSGEIVVVALLPAYEGRGIGKAVLSLVVKELRSAGFQRLYLGCSSNPSHRSHGFYRHLGWSSTGSRDERGDEILELTGLQEAGGA